ncbi:PAS domain-containing protein [Neofusicoccum parvum]|uniref:PAS domain-containing protein n=1 Tax=Neofusicoccum parvum TaxID=310453 RepID=A0ACB5RXZ4_9PEZI|nr:PAS domain-containing protein [Neofusicoccum parvum]GME54785.1 PAS domain-containing protein [Neofusicoccum parvum]
MSKGHFEIIKPISKGAFGSVYLSKKKSTGDYFAIKVLKKADMVAKNQVTNVKAERAIMMWQGESDFVAKLYWTFSSKDYLYLVMEYLNGGDCASLIKVLGALPEDWAKKYLAEVVLGVEHLHSRGIVHRDLKPDNLLIDQKGHLKLTDFGLSRMGLIGRQKRALNSKSDDQAPDLLKGGPFHRALSVTSSRSASFDMQGSQHSPQNTPSLTPALSGDLNQPSYFSLSKESNREPSRRTSTHRSDSGESDALHSMFRRFSIVDDAVGGQRRSPIDEEVYMSEDGGSPDPYALHPTISHSSAAQNATPPQNSGMLPPPMALFDPEDSNRRFVGTPDYLAPETINGSGQDEVSDWWSLGCILFECLYGYPPFHADTPDEVFQNILERKIDWPPEDEYEVSPEAKDLMNRLMCTEPAKRLGANIDEKYSSGGDEIKHHPWFADMNWDTLREDEASFVPASENPEDTEYFDARGATMQNFAAEFEDQAVSSAGTPGADYPDRPHDALSRLTNPFAGIQPNGADASEEDSFDCWKRRQTCLTFR